MILWIYIQCTCAFLPVIKMLCVHVHLSHINTSTLYLSLMALHSPISVILSYSVWILPKCFSFLVSLTKSIVLLYDDVMYCMDFRRFSSELTHFFYSHGVLRDDAQWRIISPVMQSGQVYNQYRCTITCKNNG